MEAFWKTEALSYPCTTERAKPTNRGDLALPPSEKAPTAPGFQPLDSPSWGNAPVKPQWSNPRNFSIRPNRISLATWASGKELIGGKAILRGEENWKSEVRWWRNILWYMVIGIHDMVFFLGDLPCRTNQREHELPQQPLQILKPGSFGNPPLDPYHEWLNTPL